MYRYVAHSINRSPPRWITRDFPNARTTGLWSLLPVGALHVPSQSIHIPKDVYEYILDTEEDEQSTSARATELMRKGMEQEQGESE